MKVRIYGSKEKLVRLLSPCRHGDETELVVSTFQMIELSRLRIIGSIDQSTPVCVIHEVAEALCIKRPEQHDPTNVVATISMVAPPCITSPVSSGKYSKTDLPLISRFVNSEVEWSSSKLTLAFHHLLEFTNDGLPSLAKGWKPGRKTMEDPMAYDSSMLYKICRYYGVRTTRATTINDMALAVALLQKDTDALRGQLVQSIPNLSKSRIVSMLLATGNASGMTTYPSSPYQGSPVTAAPISLTTSPYKIDPARLEEAKHIIHGRLKSSTRSKPQTHYEAIILAMMSFGLNLIESSNPIGEYERRLTVGMQYMPIDPEFKARYQRNPLRYDTRQTWIPMLSSCYSTEELHRFALAEGFLEAEIAPSFLEGNSAIANLLHLARVTPTFYLGRYSDREASPISLESFEGVEPELIISYGIPDMDPIVLFASDWANMFVSTRRFVSPACSSERIENRAIQKLLRIVSRFEGEKSSRGEIYRRLREGINAAIKTDRMVTEYCDRLKERYDKGNAHLRESICAALKYIAEIGYYMRGWKLESDKLPIKDEDCKIREGKHIQLDLNVTEAIARYEAHIKISSIRDLIIEMPLITLSDSSEGVTFIASVQRNEGHTIEERLAIVRKYNGVEDEDNTPACIRLTSNYLLISYHFFSSLLSLTPDFSIHDLAFIS